MRQNQHDAGHTHVGFLSSPRKMHSFAHGKGRFAAWGVMWLLLAALCMAGGVSAMEAALPSAMGRVACRYDGEGPSVETLRILREGMAQSARDKKAEGTATAWSQAVGAEVAYQEIGSSLEVDALWIDGDARGIWHWKALRGSLPVFDTARVCALDRETALLLFGSMDIVGQSVEIGGVSYEVTCVFERPEGLSAWTADPGNGLALCPALALEEPPPFQALDFDVIPLDAQTPKEWAEAWLNESRAPTPDFSDALGQERRLLTLASECGSIMLALLVLWALGKAAIGILRRAAAEARACWSDRSLPAAQGWRAWAIGLAGAGALVAFAAWAIHLAQISVDVPPDYLPTRWSDVSFWPTLARESAEKYAARRMMGALRPDMVREHLCAVSASLSLAAAPLLGLAWHGLHQSGGSGVSLPRLGATFLCGIAIPPLALWCVRGIGLPPVLPTGLPPLLLILLVVAQCFRDAPAKLSTYSWKNQKEVSL